MCNFMASKSVIIIILTCFRALSTQTPPASNILSFEYGEHEPEEQVSFIYNGVIPAFKPMYKLNVTTNREDLQKNLTYLRAEYLNVMSSVLVLYDPEKIMLTFHIKFPFTETLIGVLGYALPIQVPSRPSALDSTMD